MKIPPYIEIANDFVRRVCMKKKRQQLYQKRKESAQIWFDRASCFSARLNGSQQKKTRAELEFNLSF